MQKTSKIHEKFLTEIWKKQNFSKSLFTQDGQKVEIIDSGMENNELGGPDFKNARIKIGNLTYLGMWRLTASILIGNHMDIA